MTISIPRLFSLARMTTATTGTGTITLGSAATVNGTTYLSFSAAGVSDGDIIAYGIQDTGASEYGYGTYTAAGTTLTRTVIRSTNSNNAINLSGSAQVFISAGNADLLWGFDTARNIGIAASVGSNILTVSLKTAAGADPSANDPVIIPFRSATASTGSPDIIAVRSALSIDTNATGATLGTASSNVPFRLWLVVFNDAGTARLALWQSVTGGATPTLIGVLDETTVASSTAMSGSATAAATFYTQNGTTVTSKAFRILGFVDYGSGLTTAGTYASAPTKIQIFGPGIKKPGDIVQTVTATTTSSTTTTSSSFQSTNSTVNITPSCTPNLTKYIANGSGRTAANASAVFTQVYRGSTALGNFVSGYAAGGIAISCMAMVGIDAPGSTSAQTYVVKLKNEDAATSVSYPPSAGGGGAYIEVAEIMV